MKSHLVIFALVALISTQAVSHSGGTDSNGCHAGSQPYHCHNSKNNSKSDGEASGSAHVGAWDINFGYQHKFEQANFIPFIGASLGKSEKHGDTDFGINLGVRFQNGWHASYVSTSKSFQLGYKFVHVSANSGYFGIGMRLPFGSADGNSSSFYYGGSILFSGDE